ncbi:MAG TPA: hypothetical protein DCE41_29970 [Cytophagales bacterium]|nr:hypothetical protein [Cytophagales bacterium]HAA18093.1 hypothetical protein [Cytophagales bacterium]HAP59878.1 hypothetical protein [Cytophagales bacterium]
MSATLTDPEGFEGIAIEYNNRPAIFTGAGFMGISIEQGGSGSPFFFGQGLQGVSLEISPFFISSIHIDASDLVAPNALISELTLHHPSESTPLPLEYDNVQKEAIVNQSFGFGTGIFTVNYTVTFDLSDGPVSQHYKNQIAEIVFGS